MLHLRFLGAKHIGSRYSDHLINDVWSQNAPNFFKVVVRKLMYFLGSSEFIFTEESSGKNRINQNGADLLTCIYTAICL